MAEHAGRELLVTVGGRERDHHDVSAVDAGEPESAETVSGSANADCSICAGRGFADLTSSCNGILARDVSVVHRPVAGEVITEPSDSRSLGQLIEDTATRLPLVWSHRRYVAAMSEATVRELRNQGGRVLDRVLAGERVSG